MEDQEIDVEENVQEPDVEENTSAPLPIVGQSFDSWTDAERCLNSYAKKNCFQWTTDTSTSIKNENKKLTGRGETVLYNEALVHKNIVLTCVSGGKKRINQGTGQRNFQATWKVDCPVMVHLIANKTALVVKKIITQHNHTCDQAYFKALPKTRRSNLNDDKATSTAKLLFKGGVKPSVVRSVLRDMGCGEVTQRDLANLRAKFKREGRKGKTPEELLCDTLQELLDTDPEAHIRVGRNEDNELEFLFIQTSGMRKTMQEFGTVLLMDHTYKINSRRMPVSVFMTMDGHGDGRPVGYAFIANERSETIANVLQSFKTSIGAECASKIKTVIIDKDYSEAKAIKNVLPDANIQLCDFHVSRTFKTRAKKEDPKVLVLINSLRYCSSEEFPGIVAELENIASEEFFDKFKKDWLNCKLAWCFRDKQKSLNLGNNTNNRLENHNSKIKMMLNQDNELHEAIQNLIKMVKNKEDDVFFRNTVESAKQHYCTKNSDPVVNTILNDMTKFSAKLMIWELQQTVTEAEMAKLKPSTKDCQCTHWCSFNLPCRHIFHQRRLADCQLYCKDEINPMWLQGYESRSEDTTPHSQNISTVVVPSKMMPHNAKDRYTHSMTLLRKIGNLMSESGERQYAERYSFLENVFELWASGKETVALEIMQAHDTNLLLQTTENHACQENAENAENNLSGETVGPENAFGFEATELNSNEERVAPINDLFQQIAEHSNTSSINIVHTSAQIHGKPDNNLPQKNVTATKVHRAVAQDLDSITPADGSDCGNDSRRESARTRIENFKSVFMEPVNQSSSQQNPSKNALMSYDGECINHSSSQTFVPIPQVKMCWCKLSCKRAVAGPSHKMAGRSFWVCPLGKCGFRTLAPKVTEDSSVKVAEDNNANNDKSTPNTLEIPIDYEVDSGTESLAMLVSLINSQSWNDCEFDECDQNAAVAELEQSENNTENSTAHETNHEEMSDNSQILDYNAVSEINTKNLSQAQMDISQAIAGVKLPLAIKHRGRPEGLGKTVWDWPKGKKGPILKKPSAARLISSVPQNEEEDRKKKGLLISDLDVKQFDEEGNVWTVRSQGKKTKGSTYKVSKDGNGLWVCECEDHKRRHITCKHIYKIMAFVKKTSSSTTVSLTLSSHTGNQCMFIFALASWSQCSMQSQK
ncbi:uncharacterized protein LOC117640701 isoform X2 [Thrips palmi]|uniref:Uncharacterized protein LOC117640701 isoform X2 n=1 Tax=Thrips palmi TaxID=161013 RepID=A0A6P8YB30_THRPL|nr:uncharacterized protein LOC117640701 isoform X2 [Thrips palmi]